MKFLLKVSYWLLAIIPVILIFQSLGYNLFDAFMIGLTFIPSALVLRWLVPQAHDIKTHQGVVALSSIFAGTFVIQLLLVLLTHYLIGRFDAAYREYQPIPVLTNPFFLSLLLGSLAWGNFFWNRVLDRKFSNEPQHITFISERHNITLPLSDILYVESRDSEVWIHAANGQKFRNKTPISQWENLLGNDFIRIHRAFLVAESAISELTRETVRIGETELPISRKYHGVISSRIHNIQH